MGFAAAFPYRSAADVFREHAALSAFENGGRRDFDIGGLADISDGAFDALDPVQWPLREGEKRQDRRTGASSQWRLLHAGPQGPLHRPRDAGRQGADQQGLSVPPQYRPGARPMAHHDAIGPERTARRASARAVRRGASHRRQGDGARGRRLCKVATRWGACVLKVVVSDGQRRGSLFAPIHWSDATASAARICDLVMPETDRYSGQPDAKATPAAIAPVRFAFRGFAFRAGR